jgi:hypothetical protein
LSQHSIFAILIALSAHQNYGERFMYKKDFVYQSQVKRLAGSSYYEVQQHALTIFHRIKHQTKRRPYIRSVYFNKQKVFFDYFWQHLAQKSFKERKRRLQFFACAIDLIQYSKHNPVSFDNPMQLQEILHRFTGRSKDSLIFYVQIKENKKTNQKYFMSVFPE